jgi:hypothetical protein
MRVRGTCHPSKDAGEWTCSDFLKVSNAAKSRVVYYLVGLNKAQMKEFHDIPAKDFDVPISKVVQHCHVWMAPADQGLFCGGAMIVGAVMSSACRCGS